MSGREWERGGVDGETRREAARELAARRAQLAVVEAARPAPRPAPARRSSKVPLIPDPPPPPDLERHVITNTPLDQIWRFVNPVMIYGRHLGLKSSVVREVEQGDRATLERTEAGRKALLLKERLDDLKQECREGAMKARAVYQFFRARGDGNDLLLLRPDGSELTRFTFPRQEGEDGLCLADYVGKDDSVCLFVTTAG